MVCESTKQSIRDEYGATRHVFHANYQASYTEMTDIHGVLFGELPNSLLLLGATGFVVDEARISHDGHIKVVHGDKKADHEY